MEEQGQQWVGEILDMAYAFDYHGGSRIRIYTDAQIIAKIEKDGIKWINVNNVRYQRAIIHVACHFRPELALFLLGLKDIDVNLPESDGYGETPIFVAIRGGYAEIIKAVWNHPQFDPNVRCLKRKLTPFLFYCSYTFCDKDLFEMMLSDRRVDVTQLSGHGDNALYYSAAFTGRVIRLLEIVELDPLHEDVLKISYLSHIMTPTFDAECITHFIASLRYLDPHKLAEIYHKKTLEVTERYRKQGKQLTYGKVGPFIKEYCNRPRQMRCNIRKEYGLQKYDSVILYVYLMLICDGYLTWNDNNDNTDDFNRAIKIALRLSMDLQMLICNRLYGLSANGIPQPLIKRALRCMIVDQNL